RERVEVERGKRPTTAVVSTGTAAAGKSENERERVRMKSETRVLIWS
ncbi:hypothetical protein A2U01_0080166, partial [Trifolium medium]|nr:hypothetical protein [Trifolium medium]